MKSSKDSFKHNVIAMVFDFDGTLTPQPMQEYTVLPRIGIEKGRVNFMWASAAEGELFAELVTKATKMVKALGPNKKFQKEW